MAEAPTTFKEASRFEMPFGKHRGQTLDKIAETDKGLGYLVWLRQAMVDEGKEEGNDVFTALRLYLDDPTIQKEIDAL